MATQIRAYDKTNWTPGLPITQERMNNIEAQLEFLTAGYNNDIVSDISTLVSNVSGLGTQVSNAIGAAGRAENSAEQALTATKEGSDAWAQLVDAGVEWRTDNMNGTTLKNLLQAIQTSISDMNTIVGNNSDAITILQTNVNSAKRTSADTLKSRFEAVEGNVSANQSAIANLSNSAAGTNYETLAERLNAIDNGSTGFRTLPAVDTELVNARGKDANNNDYSTLSARLTAMDGKIATTTGVANGAIQATKIINDTLDSTDGTAVLGGQIGGVIKNAIASAKSEAITAAREYAVPKTAIADNYDTDTAGYVLGAGQGKDLNTRLSAAESTLSAALVSSTIRTNNQPTTFGSLDLRLEKIEEYDVEIENAHRTDLGLDEETGEPIQDTLRDRFEAIETIQASNNTALNTRVTALENEVDMTSANSRIDIIDTEVTNARTSHVIQTENNDTVYPSLKDRLEAIESHAATVRTDISTIANELAMVDDVTHNIKDTNTKIDDLTADVAALASEINMSQDQNGRLIGAETRIDDIDAEIVAAHKQTGTDAQENPIYAYNDLDERFNAIETDIDHIHNSNIPNDPADGLKQQINTINSTLGNGFDTSTNTVAAKITNLENNKISTSAIYNGVDQANTGYVLDASQGKYLNDLITHAANEQNNDPGGLTERLDAIDNGTNSTISELDTRLDAIDGGSTLDITNGTLSERVAANELKISHIKDNNNENDKGGLEQRMDAAEGAIAGKANSSDLANKANVTDVSFTIIKQKNEVTYITNAQNETVPSGTQNWTIVERNDYLLQNATDDKYYYWKYIGTAPNGNWHLISGAGGGTGNTSGADLTRAQYNALASTTGYAENTDYYVTEDSGLIRHYRYVTINNTLTEIEIGPLTSNIKRYNISSGIETTKVDNVDTDVTYLYLHEFAYGEDNDEPGSDTIITRIPLPAGGGAAISSQKMVRITERNITQPLGATTPVELKFFYTSGVAKESGIGELYIDNVLKIDNISITSGDPKDASSTWPTVTQENPLPDGFYSIDVSEYCTELGTKQFRIKISDPDDETGTMWKDLKWDVNVMNLTISSTFTNHSINALNSTVKFIYTANGDIDKVVNFKLGNTLLPTVNLNRNTSGVPQEYNIAMPQAGAGAYRLEVWLTATANGHALPPSQSIYRDIIWYDTSSSDMIISSPYRDNVDEPVTQYDTLEIPYTIVGGTTPYTVYYYVDDMSEPINEVTLTGNTGIWEFRADEDGSHNLKIECGTASITFSLNVTELPIDIAPETINLILDFNPQGITNTSNKRLWTNGTYHMTVSNNFDWYNGGYGSDNSGDYFLVKAGTRAVFDYKMFTSVEGENNALVNEVFENGKEMKIIFKTAAVRNADAVWFTNMGPSSSNENAKQVGIQLSAHNGFLKTDSASNVEVGGVAATNTYLYFPYSEEDKIELDININKTAENNNFIMSYEDGCPSKAYPYKTSEILYHIEGQEQDITIGSDDCDVYIYRIRIYNTELTTEQVLRNFIADGKNSSESIDRYNRNCIFYDTNKKAFTPYTNNNTILDPERLAIKIPDVKVLMLETPRFTTNKKDFVPYSSLRCIHAPGGKYFKSRGKEDNWLFQNGYHAGQGTTSDKYGNAGRNLDFLFMCDGIHNPSDKVSVKKENFLPGYQSSLILGYGTDEQQAPTYCLDWKDEDTWTENKEYEVNDLVRYDGEVYKCIAGHTSTSTFDSASWTLQEGYTSKVTLTSTSIPNNFFNLKVNIASSENANNALLQKRYNDFLLYSSPAHERDSRIKNDMEFVPAVIFVRETGIMDPDGTATVAERQEFNDDQWHFYALGNIGDSKKTDYTRAYDPQDMNEFTLEISDNNTNNSQFQSGVYMANYYRLVDDPIIDNIDDYYVTDGITGTVEYNNETQYYGNFIKTLDTEIDNEHTYYTFIEQRRAIEPYTLEQDMDDGKPVEGSFTARSAAGQSIQTTEYLFPLQEGEWNSNNMRYWSLFNEGFDGDHSFEMRYACKGDYRDGKVVNDTTGRAKAQLKLNEGVWRAFYTWLVTTDNPTFVNELDQWIVRSSVEYYYAFTHYYTMMDNRAKNTFWHFAKTGKHRKVTTPVAALLHIYEEADGTVTPSQGDPNVYEGTFVTTSDATIDSNKQYYTQYAFDMWVYDTDTALGIDNNGELVFPYGKEDTDYRVEGDASSSMVFNGAGSIFWCRLRDNCIDDIRSVFTSVLTECFNANNLINEFDKWQECYPEAIWRLDVERKYIRSFTGDTGPNGEYLTRKETRFLRDMMQGRKKYQRRQWVKDQDIYFGSKYMLPSVRDDFFEFSCYQPAGQAVTPNWDLTITPYQDMYINISYAETFASPFRAKAGVTYEFKSIFDQMNDSRIRVFGANHIQGLAGKAKREDPNDPEKITGADGLASFYIKANNFEHGKKLRKLILGTDNPSYQNGNFTSLNIANDYPILEEFNIKNCGNLGGSLDFSNSTALKIIEAQGTQITQVMLPSSTGIEVLHLPETVTKVALASAKRLNEITIKNRSGNDDLSNLTQLDINDSDYSNNINWMTIAKATLSHLDLVSLLGLSTSSINDINELEPFKQRKTAISRVYLGGILKVLGTYSTAEKTDYEALWQANRLTLDVSNGTLEEKHLITFRTADYDDGEGNVIYGRELKSLYIRHGEPVPDIYYDGTLGFMPTQESTVKTIYTFGKREDGEYIPYSGWSTTADGLPISELTRIPTVNDAMTIYAHFETEDKVYQVNWYLRRDSEDPTLPDTTTFVKSSSGFIEYGHGETLEAPTVEDIHKKHLKTYNVTFNGHSVTYSIFAGWEKLPTKINPSASDTTYNIFARWEGDTNKPLIDLFENVDNPTPEQLVVFAAMPSQLKAEFADKIGVGKRFTCNLGHDSVKPGIAMIDSPLRLRYSPDTYSNAVDTGIIPFNGTDDAFTIMIDYCFDSNATYNNVSAAVLAGCYYNNTGTQVMNSLALYYNLNSYGNTIALGPRIGFGDWLNNAQYSVPIGNTNTIGMRNIVVLRHMKGDNAVYVYSGYGDSNNNGMNTAIISTNSASWTPQPNNATFWLGRLSDNNSSDYTNMQNATTKAIGIIYQAKYWNEDLGQGECKRLAAWPHEPMTYIITAASNNATVGSPADNNTPVPSLGITALTASSHSRVVQSASQGSTAGWDSSVVRTICNNRIFASLPIKLQAILSKPMVKFYNATWGTVNGISSYSLAPNTSNINDYIYLSSEANLNINKDTNGNSTSEYINEISGLAYESAPFPYLDASNVTFYNYTNEGWIETTESGQASYMNLRFPVKPLSSEIRIFKEYVSVPTNGNIITTIRSVTTPRTGDIFITVAGQAYMYVLNADLPSLIYGEPNTGRFADNNGIWIASKEYWLRSITLSSSGTRANLMWVNNVGTLITGDTGANTLGLTLNYQYTI